MCPLGFGGPSPLCRTVLSFSTRSGLPSILPAFCLLAPLPSVPVLLIQRSVVLTCRVTMSLRVFCLPRSMFARWAIPDGVASSWPGDLP